MAGGPFVESSDGAEELGNMARHVVIIGLWLMARRTTPWGYPKLAGWFLLGKIPSMDD